MRKSQNAQSSATTKHARNKRHCRASGFVLWPQAA